MADTDIRTEEASRSNWEVYKDAFAPQPSNRRVKAWERAPVAAHAPRLQGHKIWKKVGIRSQHEKENHNEAFLELQKEGAGARKKARVVGAKENIGTARWQNEYITRHSTDGTLITQDTDEPEMGETRVPLNDADSNALQFVPRKRTNTNHVITPKSLRHGDRSEPNVKSPQKRPVERRRKSIRKSIRKSTRLEQPLSVPSTGIEHRREDTKVIELAEGEPKQEPISAQEKPVKVKPLEAKTDIATPEFRLPLSHEPQSEVPESSEAANRPVPSDPAIEVPKGRRRSLRRSARQSSRLTRAGSAKPEEHVGPSNAPGTQQEQLSSSSAIADNVKNISHEVALSVASAIRTTDALGLSYLAEEILSPQSEAASRVHAWSVDSKTLEKSSRGVDIAKKPSDAILEGFKSQEIPETLGEALDKSEHAQLNAHKEKAVATQETDVEPTSENAQNHSIPEDFAERDRVESLPEGDSTDKLPPAEMESTEVNSEVGLGTSSDEDNEVIEPISLGALDGQTMRGASEQPLSGGTSETLVPDPLTTELTETISLNAPSTTYDHDDTDMLRSFLTRVKANKAAKAGAAAPKRKRSLPHSPLKIPLGEAGSYLSPSQNHGDEFDVSLPPESPATKRSKHDPGLDEDDVTAPRSIRRSGRTRLPVKAPAGAPSFIPVRRLGQDGDTTITLKKNEDKELAALTRVNTRKNSAGALKVATRLAKQAEEREDPVLRQRLLKEVFDERAHREKNGGKRKSVAWAEELAQFQTMEDRKVELEKDQEKEKTGADEKKGAVKVGVRSKMALGMAVNGTPAPKRRIRGLP